MAFSLGSRKRQDFNEINITPLTDVFLVLLVIMLLIAPLLDNQAALKINPPSANSAKTKSAQSKIKSILIEVNKEGAIAINGKVLIPEKEGNDQIFSKLYNKITEISPLSAAKGEKPQVKLKADDKATHGRIVSVYDAVAKAKSKGQVGKLVLITVKKN